MRIALGQIDMGFENKEIAMELCSQLMAEAKEKGVDFVVFPFTHDAIGRIPCRGSVRHIKDDVLEFFFGPPSVILFRNGIPQRKIGKLPCLYDFTAAG